MREIEIHFRASSTVACSLASLEAAIAGVALTTTMRGTLKSLPGSTHWHLKRGHERGTLEITFDPARHRAWFSVQDGRRGDWIAAAMEALQRAL